HYDWNLQDNLSLYSRLGVAYWNAEKTRPLLDNLDATGFSPLGEVGLRYNLTPSLSLSAGYQYIDSIGKSNTGKYGSHAAMISLAYTFGRIVQSAPIETIAVVVGTPEPRKEVIDSEPQPTVWVFSDKTIKGGFGIDSVTFSDNFVQSLGEVASVLKAHPKARAVIVGHTDSTGTATYNQMLSERRAQAVLNQLVDLGLNPERLESRGEGESNPIADNNTAAGRAKNRRVEVTIPSFKFQ
ncbi:OmpA family protein, partial [Vibrio cholerae]|nr:OmpA family protein [Vibrio cholerae]EGR5456904.1 OmpA family protein [Vibrio cholerae]EGR5464546.1 OmpA family protein [Vibrio cholerae]